MEFQKVGETRAGVIPYRYKAFPHKAHYFKKWRKKEKQIIIKMLAPFCFIISLFIISCL